MKHSIYILLVLGLAVMAGCSKKPTDYRSFVGGKEIVYSGAVTHVSVLPGNHRIKLQWSPSPDPSITRYVVYWNNNSDSQIVAAKSHLPTDTINCLIDSLQEYSYTFFIVAYDSAGNKSITKEVDNARVYGSIYQNSLLNRPVNTDQHQGYSMINDSTVRIYFLVPDTINVTTHLRYTNASGSITDAWLPADSTSIILTGFRLGTNITWQSSYIPARGSIDTFTTPAPDTLVNVNYRILACGKSAFVALNLPNDIQPLFPSVGPAVLWNGSTTPQSWPNVARFNGYASMPQHFSFDMGRVYPHLVKMEEIGRIDDPNQNPVDFEVWGIADTTGAITKLPGNDPSWKIEALSKGWTLLTEVQRSDNGVVPMTYNLVSNPPPVRFIMIRMVRVYDNSTNANMTQLTFWAEE